MDSLGVIADEEVNTDADVKVGMDADVADDNMEDGPARTKESERTRIGDFQERNNLAGCSRACGETRLHVPAAEIFKKTSSYFGICPSLLIFSPNRISPP
ncbi:hypothetical protein F2Q70_00011627 [Brassica cretica]|uniref:Uncharacterized protein n=2 Tax=Brassica cretica TaxID=69181 RepID=A0A8S9MA13_BRACR|nr:hypothetical protein F2Q68_00004713 [Brassica cretica]KAF2614731.1 hypothetical protein F2Q70_00011627 [Brassica cretica]KAF3548969.1 hypothetical protein DY000_02007010 [Brassica cretica]